MKHNLSLIRFALPLGLLALAGKAAALPIAQLGFARNYVQTGPSTSSDDTANGPFQFLVAIDANAILTAGPVSFTYPPSSTSVSGLGTGQSTPGATVPLSAAPATLPPLSTSGNAYEFSLYFPTQAAMDAVTPNGNGIANGSNYLLNFNAHVYLEYSSGFYYPNPPLVTASQGTWTNGKLVVDPAQDLTLTLNYSGNFIPGYAYMDLRVIGMSGTYFNDVQSPPSYDVNKLTMTIPADALTGGGSQYSVRTALTFWVHVDTTATPGINVVLNNSSFGSFVIQAGQATPPVITTQPQSQTVLIGGPATLSVQATSASTATYQWYKDGSMITGATQSSYQISTTTAASAGAYTVTVTNAGGSVTSSGATLTINANVAPSFTTQPSSQTVVTGSTVAFNAVASGAPAPTYQWTLNGSAISGATSARLVISNAASANAGTYTCTATNSSGTATSTSVTLALTSTANPGRLINLSVNTVAGPGAQALTVGFVTGGAGTSGSQTLLARASGPALTAFGVPGVMTDPTLTILSGSTVVASNSGWASTPGNQAAVTAADTATYAFALTDPTSLDSATVVTLATNPGYTMQVASKTGLTGRTLAEVYDDTPSGTYTATTPRLINISCRIEVSAGSSLTAGFTIGGTTSKTVLIRASGPALSAFGVSGVMADPQLKLFDSGGAVLLANAGWGGDAQLTAAMNAVYAFTYSDSASKDSAVLVILPPGSYTAQASSVSGAAGTTLVEVYEVP